MVQKNSIGIEWKNNQKNKEKKIPVDNKLNKGSLLVNQKNLLFF